MNFSRLMYFKVSQLILEGTPFRFSFLAVCPEARHECYRNLCKKFDSNGVKFRIHKNRKKVPQNAYIYSAEG